MSQTILKRKLSTRDVVRILNGPEKVDKLSLSRGAYNHLPKKAKRALEAMGVKIEIVDLKRGKRPTTDVKQIEQLSHLSANEIAMKTRVPLRTVYYHLKKIRRASSASSPTASAA